MGRCRRAGRSASFTPRRRRPTRPWASSRSSSTARAWWAQGQGVRHRLAPLGNGPPARTEAGCQGRFHCQPGAKRLSASGPGPHPWRRKVACRTTSDPRQCGSWPRRRSSRRVTLKWLVVTMSPPAMCSDDEDITQVELCREHRNFECSRKHVGVEPTATEDRDTRLNYHQQLCQSLSITRPRSVQGVGLGARKRHASTSSSVVAYV